MNIYRKAVLAIIALILLSAFATGANAAACSKQLPANGIVPTRFCIDGDLAQGGKDIFTWTLSKARSVHPWRWNLRGAQGVTTRLEIFTAPQKGNDQSKDQKPLYTLLDTSPLTQKDPRIFRAGNTDTIMLRPGRYRLEVSCDGACTGKGDPYTLEAAAFPSEHMLGYLSEQAPDDRSRPAQPIPVRFALNGNLEGSEDVYTWMIPKIDDECWQILMFLPAGDTGWMKLYDPDGRLVAQRRAGKRSNGKAVFKDIGVGAGRYTIRLGPGKNQFTPYLLFSQLLGTRTMQSGNPGTTLACPVLAGD